MLSVESDEAQNLFHSSSMGPMDRQACQQNLLLVLAVATYPSLRFSFDAFVVRSAHKKRCDDAMRVRGILFVCLISS